MIRMLREMMPWWAWAFILGTIVFLTLTGCHDIPHAPWWFDRIWW